MNYELRFKTGEVHPIGATPSLTDDQQLALQSGAAQLVRIDARGESTVVLDVDDITELSSRDSAHAPVPVGCAGGATDPSPTAPVEMGAPLLSIRVSGSEAFRADQCFETFAAFDAALRAARRIPQYSGQTVSCVITWKDATTFQASLSLSGDSDEYLVDRVLSVYATMVKDPERSAAAAVMLDRMFAVAMAESRVSTETDAVREEAAAKASRAESASPPQPPRAGLEPSPRRGYRRSMSSKTPCYATEGPLRGRCGHKHRDLESAVDCLDADEKRCVALGGHTDRRIVFMAPGVKRELNDDERAAMARYRAESRNE